MYKKICLFVLHKMMGKCFATAVSSVKKLVENRCLKLNHKFTENLGEKGFIFWFPLLSRSLILKIFIQLLSWGFPKKNKKRFNVILTFPSISLFFAKNKELFIKLESAYRDWQWIGSSDF